MEYLSLHNVDMRKIMTQGNGSMKRYKEDLTRKTSNEKLIKKSEKLNEEETLEVFDAFRKRELMMPKGAYAQAKILLSLRDHIDGDSIFIQERRNKLATMNGKVIEDNMLGLITTIQSEMAEMYGTTHEKKLLDNIDSVFTIYSDASSAYWIDKDTRIKSLTAAQIKDRLKNSINDNNTTLRSILTMQALEHLDFEMVKNFGIPNLGSDNKTNSNIMQFIMCNNIEKAIFCALTVTIVNVMSTISTGVIANFHMDKDDILSGLWGMLCSALYNTMYIAERISSQKHYDTDSPMNTDAQNEFLARQLEITIITLIGNFNNIHVGVNILRGYRPVGSMTWLMSWMRDQYANENQINTQVSKQLNILQRLRNRLEIIMIEGKNSVKNVMQHVYKNGVDPDIGTAWQLVWINPDKYYKTLIMVFRNAEDPRDYSIKVISDYATSVSTIQYIVGIQTTWEPASFTTLAILLYKMVNEMNIEELAIVGPEQCWLPIHIRNKLVEDIIARLQDGPEITPILLVCDMPLVLPAVREEDTSDVYIIESEIGKVILHANAKNITWMNDRINRIGALPIHFDISEEITITIELCKELETQEVEQIMNTCLAKLLQEAESVNNHTTGSFYCNEWPSLLTRDSKEGNSRYRLLLIGGLGNNSRIDRLRETTTVDYEGNVCKTNYRQLKCWDIVNTASDSEYKKIKPPGRATKSRTWSVSTLASRSVVVTALGALLYHIRPRHVNMILQTMTSTFGISVKKMLDISTAMTFEPDATDLQKLIRPFNRTDTYSTMDGLVSRCVSMDQKHMFSYLITAGMNDHIVTKPNNYSCWVDNRSSGMEAVISVPTMGTGMTDITIERWDFSKRKEEGFSWSSGISIPVGLSGLIKMHDNKDILIDQMEMSEISKEKIETVQDINMPIIVEMILPVNNTTALLMFTSYVGNSASNNLAMWHAWWVKTMPIAEYEDMVKDLDEYMLVKFRGNIRIGAIEP